MFSIARPFAFLFLIPIVPAVLLSWVRFRRLVASLGSLYGNDGAHTMKAQRHLARIVWGKTLLRSACWLFLVLAFAGISWGKKTVPVQKSGAAICFVFDISYSMNARDAGRGLSRLDAARHYATSLLDTMVSPSVSVVLAKGDGVLAVPLTEDRASLQSLLDVLSPELMTAAGSSIGRGIQAALNSFPHNVAQSPHVWVFTDGDETDNGLQAALDDAVRYGIPVALIGFGSESGAEVTAGDGKTKVHTVLNAGKLLTACDRANEKNTLPSRKNRTELIQYVQATAPGSAYQLLRSISAGKISALFDSNSVSAANAVDNSMSSLNETTYSYEVQNVDRHGLFLLLALICFVTSFVVGEFDGAVLRRSSSSILLVLCVLVPLLFTSCNVNGNSSILKGAWAWYQKKFHQATAIFLQANEAALAEQDSELEQYALFGLSATYLAQEEYDAALTRLAQIAPDAPVPVRSAALYNEGIVAHHNGENTRAISLFKSAILADPNNTNAKINLELCQTEESMRQAQGAEKEMQQTGESKDNSALQKGVFTLIKENEQNQWKKVQSNKKDDGVIDF
ncbi:MAG: VWA domain-containing protein [Treponema sp.]|nr:VWA domain-containing protein [Treponema sp.]